MASNKEVQQKLREELLQLLPTKDTPVTSSILNDAEYLKAVVKEINRIAAITLGNLRATVKDMVLCGYQIPKGVSITAGNVLIEHYKIICLENFDI